MWCGVVLSLTHLMIHPDTRRSWGIASIPPRRPQRALLPHSHCFHRDQPASAPSDLGLPINTHTHRHARTHTMINTWLGRGRDVAQSSPWPAVVFTLFITWDRAVVDAHWCSLTSGHHVVGLYV